MDSFFLPPRRNGSILHAALVLLLGGGGGVSFWSALQQTSGSDLVFYLALALLLLLPVPLLLYRFFALSQASYALERDGLRIRWGLRAEDIPLPQIEWVRPASELGFALRLPLGASPGAILGILNVEGLGTVEFIASDSRTMLLVATPNKVYAISPADPRAFIRSFRQVIEMGSLTPLVYYSTRPTVFLEKVLSDRPARILISAGFALMTAVLVAVVIRIPMLRSVSLGFDAARQPLNPGPAESLLLLPVFSGFAYFVDLAVGMYFYRYELRQPLAYLLWGAGAAACLLLLAGVLFARAGA